MNPNVIITCAVTGAGDTVGKHPAIPVTPEQIANAALEAADAGAAVVHCHVRDPKTGKGARGVDLYREVVERIRAKNKDVIINLTAGMGGDLEVGAGRQRPCNGARSPISSGPMERLLHIAELRPEICTLDCGTLNFGDGNTIVVQTPAQLREQAKLIQSYGVKPEMEIFDSGNLWFAKQLVRRRPDRRSAAVPALPRHSLGRAGQHPDHGLSGRRIADERRLGGLRHRPQGVSRWSRRPSSSAAMSASASKTTSGSRRACMPRTARWSRKPSSIITLLGSKVASPGEARDLLKLARRLMTAS